MSLPGEVPMAGVRHDEDEGPPLLAWRDGRAVVRAYNQGGHDLTEVDLLDLLRWLAANRPDLLREAGLSAATPEE